MRQRARRERIVAVLAAIVVIGLSAGCGDNTESKSNASSAAAPARAAGSAGSAGGGLADSGPSHGAAPASGQNALAKAPVPGRSLVYTASLTVRTKDVAGATANAERLATANGGFVGDEKSQSGTVPDVQGLTQSTVTLRVPSTAFDDVIGQLGGGGVVQNETRSASDVTAQVVDTGTRVSAQQASIARITELMKNATNMSDVVSLEGELSRREADLESMQAQLAALKDQVSLSTITVTFLLPEVPASPPPAPVVKHQNALQRGLHDGWQVFVGTAKVLMVIVGALLPFAVTAAVLWWPVTRLARRTAARIRTVRSPQTTVPVFAPDPPVAAGVAAGGDRPGGDRPVGDHAAGDE